MVVEKKIENRNLPLDIIRGIAVFGMLLSDFPGNWSYVCEPLHYSESVGSTFADMLCSFFLFTVGASMFYSLLKYGVVWSKQLVIKILVRTFVLFSIGVALNLLKQITNPVISFQIMGDLQYLAVSYLVASILVLFLKRKHLLILLIVLIMIAHHVLLLQLFSFPFILKFLGYVSVVLTGYVTMSLGHNRRNRFLLALGILIIGLSGLLISSVLNRIYPVSRILMTGSFVTEVVSYAWIIYGFLVFFVEIIKWNKCTYPFKVFGMNALFVYVTANFIDILLRNIPACKAAGYLITPLEWLYNNIYVMLFGNNVVASMSYAVVFMLLMWLFAFLLYRRKIFIKI
jgi:predicted acyltransferase